MVSGMSRDQQPVIREIADFDRASGSLGERLLFNHRGIVLALCVAVTLFLGSQALKVRLNASFENMIPTHNTYIANYLANKADLGGLGNSIRIALETTKGDIFDPNYMLTLQKMNDEIFLLPGVDRPFMKSLWTPATRWTAVTEDGLDGGPVIPEGYDSSAASMASLRSNVARSGEIGSLVARDFKSSVIFVPLLDKNPETGRALDYGTLSHRLEDIRSRYATPELHIHITGFAKMVGDLIGGLGQIVWFFLAAIAITASVLFWYTRCWRSTALVVTCSLIAVLWQIGMLPTLGYALDPYSILVPFLVFAIGMSHGAQKMNGIMQDIGRGTHRLVAARYTFRRLFMAGLTALLCDAVGFAVLMIIRIRVIQDLAAIASIGVAGLVFTNLVLLPVLLSYTGVGREAAKRSLASEEAAAADEKHPVWTFLDNFTRRKWAVCTIVGAVAMAGAATLVSQSLRIGDLDPGSPELRQASRYNRDNAFMVDHYAASSDIFVVMVKTPPNQCTAYDTLAHVDDLSWQLQQLPGVEGANSMAAFAKIAGVGYNEGNLKWYGLLPNQAAIGGVQTRAPRDMFNQSCTLLALYVYLKDHKADTLTSVVDAVTRYDAALHRPDLQFQLAAGNAGIEAATNIVVKSAMDDMLYWVYGAVILLCYVTFRSWRAVLVAVLPLILTSILCEALMVELNMGVKVATLPVIALGVGIGVDYALYVLTIVLACLRRGMNLSEAYYSALLFTGRVVMLTGATLALAVSTWVLSPIKFQADMGVLLAFMFLFNMLGALILLPALGYLLFPALPLAPPRAQQASDGLHISTAGTAT